MTAANLTITLSGSQGSGKSALGLAIIETLRSRPDVIRLQPNAEGAFHRADGTEHVAVIGMMDDGALVMLETRQADESSIPTKNKAVDEADATAMATYLKAARAFPAGEAQPGRWIPRPAPADAKITMSPDAVQDGDRVRFIIEGTVDEGGDWGGFSQSFIRKAVERFGDRATVELLERPEKPLATGDKVIGPFTDEPGHIRHIAHGIAAVEFPDDFRTIALDDLVRAPIA